jgi:hypothetical protein
MDRVDQGKPEDHTGTDQEEYGGPKTLRHRRKP